MRACVHAVADSTSSGRHAMSPAAASVIGSGGGVEVAGVGAGDGAGPDGGFLVRASLPLDDESVLEAARRSRGFPLFALQQLHAWAHAGEMELSHGTYRVSI